MPEYLVLQIERENPETKAMETYYTLRDLNNQSHFYAQANANSMIVLLRCILRYHQGLSFEKVFQLQTTFATPEKQSELNDLERRVRE